MKVAGAAQALFQGRAALDGFGGVGGSGAGEAAEDLLADRGGRLEGGEELDELRLDDVRLYKGLVAGVAGAACGAAQAKRLV